MLKPLMQYVLEDELKAHPEKDKAKEEKAAVLGQELLEKLWQPEEKPATFWGKVKSVLTDDVGLAQKLFNRMNDFRMCQGLVSEKQEMQRVLFYATKAFREGTEMLAAGCYLFNHNPLAFEGYATTRTDFEEDIRQSTYDEGQVFMPALGLGAVGVAVVAGGSRQEEYRADDRRLPLCSFAPIKYGIHPCLTKSEWEIKKYQGMFSEFSLQGFKTDPYRYVALKKLLYLDQPESHYPDKQHKAIVAAMNAFNECLQREPVKVCAHKGNQTSADKQKTI